MRSSRPSIFYLTIARDDKLRESIDQAYKRLERFSFIPWNDKLLNLSNGYSVFLRFSNPRLLDERSNGLIYVDFYPDDLSLHFEKLQLDISLKDLVELLDRMDGFFTGFIIKDSRLILFRDHVGAIPSCYRISEDSITASSFRVMVDDAICIPPGRIIEFIDNSSRIHRWYKWKPFSGDYLGELKNRLSNVFSRYLPEEFTLGFSGGLDSSIIAYIGSMLGKKIECITVGTEDSIDFTWAEEAATLLGLRLKKIKLDEQNVRDALENVSRFLVDPSVIDLSISSIFYLVASNSSFDNVVSGQGADEVFGGYHKYFRLGLVKGAKYVSGVMVKDMLEIYKTNIERDCLVMMLKDKRLILPYLAKPLYDLAFSIPVELKIGSKRDDRKILLRRAGQIIGIPERLLTKPKKAMQYSSKIQKMIMMKKNL